MKLKKHIIPVDIGDGKTLIINSLNGLMDKVDEPVINIMKKWRDIDTVEPENDFEVELYTALKNRGYLAINSADEEQQKNAIVQKMREKQNAKTANCSHITFIMTYDCNFCCPYCFEGESYVKKEILTPAHIDSALELAGDNLKSVGLFGGEPLLLSNISALKYLISKTSDKKFSITTNGYYLVEFFDMLSKLDILHIMVTLDGEEGTHNSRRFLLDGSPSFEKIMQGIELYLKNKIPIRIRMNLDNDNLDEGIRLKQNLVTQFVKYAEWLTFEVSPMISDDAIERNDIFAELFCNDIELDYDERVRRNKMMNRFSPIVNTITAGAKLHPVYSFCHAHTANTLLVDPYGFIYPCLLSVGVEELAVGKYHPVVEWKENSIHARNIETIAECSDCVYSLLCGGGCPIGLPSYEDVMRPMCFSIKNQIHNILPRFYRMSENEKTKVKDE